MEELDILQMDPLLSAAFIEDVGSGDVTTLATIPEGRKAKAVLLSKVNGVLAGMLVACRAFEWLDPEVSLKRLAEDGSAIKPGQNLLEVVGDARSILTAERTALNFVQQLSGVATKTAYFVKLIAGTKAKIVDTRKTVPGMRMLQKYAVRMGGGTNHRIGLYDAVLIKDNHIECAGGVTPAVKAARGFAPSGMKVEVETETLDQVREALEAKADAILLDNMSPEMMKEAVKMIHGDALVEASGGINEKTVRAAAETGVDWISIGALTHSAPALDLSLEIEKIY